MVPGRTRASQAVPIVAAVVALAYVTAAIAAPGWLGAVTVGAALGACGLALARRPARRLAWALVAIGGWLGAGLVLAWWLRADPSGGLWVILGLFLVPLPVLPWLYAATFSSGHGPRATGHEAGGGLP